MFLFTVLVVTAVHTHRGVLGSPIDGCPKLPWHPPPTHIKDLWVSDISVVAGMGDSITAGFALNNVPEDHRGLSYCCGDARNESTLFNFVKHFNPRARGGAEFDLAVTGDVVQGMTAQATRLIKALKANHAVDFARDWKLLTIWIGANNECPSCEGNIRNQPEAYHEEMAAALELLQREVPRLFVNLVAMLNLTSLAHAPGVGIHCPIQHILTRIECPCAFGSAAMGAEMNSVIQRNNAALFNIELNYRSRNLTDFAVVVQPGLKDMEIPDWHYLSRFDCFHPSRLCHEQIALGLFNNMQQPVGQKDTNFEPPVKLICPRPNAIPS